MLHGCVWYVCSYVRKKAHLQCLWKKRAHRDPARPIHVVKLFQIQNPFLTAQSTQIKSVISVPIKDFIHHYPRALFNDIPRVGAHFYDIPGSGRTFTTYPGRDALLRHTRVKLFTNASNTSNLRITILTKEP